MTQEQEDFWSMMCGIMVIVLVWMSGVWMGFRLRCHAEERQDISIYYGPYEE